MAARSCLEPLVGEGKQGMSTLSAQGQLNPRIKSPPKAPSSQDLETRKGNVVLGAAGNEDEKGAVFALSGSCYLHIY